LKTVEEQEPKAKKAERSHGVADPERIRKEEKMKFSLPRSRFLSVLTNVATAVPNRTTLPVLGNFLISAADGKVKVSATDLDIAVTSVVPANVAKAGAVTVPARLLDSLVRELPETSIEISSHDNRVEVKADKGSYRLGGMSADEFPRIPESSPAKLIRVPGPDLVGLIQRVRFATSRDETRPVLGGILWQTSGDMMTMVATDGHRLAKVSVANKKLKGMHDDVIVPPKALELVEKLVGGDETKEVGILFGDKNIIFDLGDTVISSRIIEGPYPDYEQVIPKGNDKKLKINRPAFMSALKRVGLLSNSLTHQVKLSLRKSSLELSSHNPDVAGEAKETLSAGYEGEELELGYNANYVLDILKQLEGEDALFQLGSNLSAGIITDGAKKNGTDYFYLLMPLRLAD
jgi:DNA polymerase-3 subunit beta